MVETASQSASSAAASDRKTDDNPFIGVLAQLLRTGVIDCITTTYLSFILYLVFFLGLHCASRGVPDLPFLKTSGGKCILAAANDKQFFGGSQSVR